MMEKNSCIISIYNRIKREDSNNCTFDVIICITIAVGADRELENIVG